VLLSPRRSRQLLGEAGFAAPQIRNFLFLPSATSWVRRFERLMSRLPLGAQYAAIGTV
jgi:hypothetical protein